MENNQITESFLERLSTNKIPINIYYPESDIILFTINMKYKDNAGDIELKQPSKIESDYSLSEINDDNQLTIQFESNVNTYSFTNKFENNMLAYYNLTEEKYSGNTNKIPVEDYNLCSILGEVDNIDRDKLHFNQDEENLMTRYVNNTFNKFKDLLNV